MTSDEFTKALNDLTGISVPPTALAQETFDSLVELIEENMKEMAKPLFQVKDSTDV